MKKYIKIIAVILITLTLFGCSSTTKEEDKNPKDIMLGYSWQKKIGEENIPKVVSITTSKSLDVKGYDYVFDISAKGDNSVRAYLVKSNEYPNYYDLIIAGNNGIVANKNSDFLFRDFPNLLKVDLTYLNTDNVTSMRGLFYNCLRLTSVNMENINTSNVTNMTSMFRGCASLQSINLKNLNTSKVTDMSYMFYGMYSLASLDLSSFDTSNVTNMSYMFANDTRLTNIDVTSFNTSKVTDISNMFYNVKSLVNLDLSSFDTSNVTNYIQTLHGCTKLKNVIISKSKWTLTLTFSKDMKNLKIIYK